MNKSDSFASRSELASPENRANALVGALQDKSIMNSGFVEDYVANAAQRWTSDNGAKVIAKAWLDADFRARLDQDATEVCAELGYVGPPQQTRLKALFNTEALRNVVVCTQCSCTAWALIGFPPDWYKVPEYRARAVRESRKVLSELGLDLPLSVNIKMWDSTADARYFVVPVRPVGTEGWSEDQLAATINKDVLIGVADPVVKTSN